MRLLSAFLPALLIIAASAVVYIWAYGEPKYHGYRGNPRTTWPQPVSPPKPPSGPGGGSKDSETLTLLKTLQALSDTHMAAEYRIPYTPPPFWPHYECDHDWIEVNDFGGTLTIRYCTTCGASV